MIKNNEKWLKFKNSVSFIDEEFKKSVEQETENYIISREISFKGFLNLKFNEIEIDESSIRGTNLEMTRDSFLLSLIYIEKKIRELKKENTSNVFYVDFNNKKGKL